MSEFINFIILNYFRQIKDDYCLKELKSILGINQHDFDNAIAYLKEKKYLEYKSYKLAITNLGEIYLISKNKLVEQKKEYIHENIFHKTKNIDEVYIPKNFLDKI